MHPNSLGQSQCRRTRFAHTFPKACSGSLAAPTGLERWQAPYRQRLAVIGRRRRNVEARGVKVLGATTHRAVAVVVSVAIVLPSFILCSNERSFGLEHSHYLTLLKGRKELVLVRNFAWKLDNTLRNFRSLAGGLLFLLRGDLLKQRPHKIFRLQEKIGILTACRSPVSLGGWLGSFFLSTSAYFCFATASNHHEVLQCSPPGRRCLHSLGLCAGGSSSDLIIVGAQGRRSARKHDGPIAARPHRHRQVQQPALSRRHHPRGIRVGRRRRQHAFQDTHPAQVQGSCLCLCVCVCDCVS